MLVLANGYILFCRAHSDHVPKAKSFRAPPVLSEMFDSPVRLLHNLCCLRLSADGPAELLATRSSLVVVPVCPIWADQIFPLSVQHVEQT